MKTVVICYSKLHIPYIIRIMYKATVSHVASFDKFVVFVFYVNSLSFTALSC